MSCCSLFCLYYFTHVRYNYFLKVFIYFYLFICRCAQTIPVGPSSTQADCCRTQVNSLSLVTQYTQVNTEMTTRWRQRPTTSQVKRRSEKQLHKEHIKVHQETGTRNICPVLLVGLKNFRYWQIINHKIK